MAIGRGHVVQDLHRLFGAGTVSGLREGELLESLAARDDAVALEALVARHGPMVLGVCRRLLRDPGDVEDAFQATFLVLVRRAGTLRDRDLLGPWLYGVAYRVAVRARALASRRQARECQAERLEGIAPYRDETLADLRDALDEELNRLPEKYRAPVILCYLEGHSYEEAAERLRWTVGELRGRLARAKDRLRAGLTRRGLAPTVDDARPRPSREADAIGACLMLLGQAPSVPRPLVQAVAHAARGGVGTAGLAGSSVHALARSLRSVLAYSVPRRTAASLLVTGLLAVGVGAMAWPGPAAPAPPTVPPAASPPPPSVAQPTTEAIADVPPAPESTPTREPSAVAMPLEGITIDGRLDDWPRDLPTYPLLQLLRSHPNYTTSGLELADIKNNEDLSASFRVGYNRGTGVIYVAAEVRDDVLLVGHTNAYDTDAMEVYIDAAHTNRAVTVPPAKEIVGARAVVQSVDPWSLPLALKDLPALQYFGVPGRGAAYGDPDGANPAKFRGRVPPGEAVMAYRRSPGLTTYEWAFRVNELHTDRPADLRPGRRIGFDIAVVDRDSAIGKPTFLCWGPIPTTFKGFDAGLLGDLILGPELQGRPPRPGASIRERSGPP